MRRSRPFPSYIGHGVPGIFLPVLLSYAAAGFPYDQARRFCATENSQPIHIDPQFAQAENEYVLSMKGEKAAEEELGKWTG